ncbi:MAG: TetR/AcrR family transcriptional regulator [Solirubrobacterales bacterium]
MESLPEHLLPVPVGRQRLPKEVMQEHQRTRVLEAATEVFAKRGYQGTTVDHIVSAGRIGVGSFYSLFGGKQECFLAAYGRIVGEGRLRIEEAIPSDAAWPDRLLVGLRVLLELIEEQPLAARIALVEVQTAGKEALAEHARNLDQTAELLRSGREASSFGDELPATLEFATVGGLTWFLQQRIAAGETDAEALLPDVLEIVAEPYLGEQATAELTARV